MEPKRAGGRHNRMLADTATIHALGADHSGHAAQLDAIAALLATVHGQLGSDALGSVGARFVAALSDAVSHQADLLGRLSERAATAGGVAHRTAAAYLAVEHGGGQAIAELGT